MGTPTREKLENLIAELKYNRAKYYSEQRPALIKDKRYDMVFVHDGYADRCGPVLCQLQAILDEAAP